MKFMAIIKSDAATEAGEFPDASFFAEMDAFNKRMMDANVMLSGEGLHASSQGARIRLVQDDVAVTPGPFPNPTDLIAGFWILQCDSLEEAVAWMKQCPHTPDVETNIEIRRVFTEEEFANM